MSKDLITYQIYIKSFCDSNNDGIGDFKGIISKLTYLKELGINAIWITPFYQSPHFDNGYDVSDYYKVDEMYGDINDLKQVINEANKLDIKVIIDVVFNHLSTESQLFKEAISSENHSSQEYFIFKDKIPNNFESFFFEPSWQYVPQINKYYYHAFSIQQADLNHTSPLVFKMCLDILKYYVDMGVAGFRFDVINFLKVQDNFHLNNPMNKEVQIHRYDKDIDGILPYLNKLITQLKAYRDVICIAEIGSDQHEEIKPYNEMFDYTFQFNLSSIKSFSPASYIKEYQKTTNDIKEPTIFTSSHDMNRAITRLFNNDINKQANLIALQCFLNGALFIYQGEEFGMNDVIIENLGNMVDIQGINTYYKYLSLVGAEDAFIKALEEGRDNSRSMVLWSEQTKLEKSWLKHSYANSLESDLTKPNSLYHNYQKLINLRNKGYFMQGVSINYEIVCEECLLLSKEANGNKVSIKINYLNNSCIIIYNKEQIYAN